MPGYIRYGGAPKPVQTQPNFWDQLKSFAQQQVQNFSNVSNSPSVAMNNGMGQLRNPLPQYSRQQYGNLAYNNGQGQSRAQTWASRNNPNSVNPYAPGAMPQLRKNAQQELSNYAWRNNTARVNPYSPNFQASQQAQRQQQSSYRQSLVGMPKPTLTNMPDTYLGQAQRKQNQYVLTTLPDTLLGQANSLAEQLAGYQTTDTTPYAGNGSGGGYDGYGNGGWGRGGGGGGGSSYEPPKPEWWLQMLNWNINRPEGG